jgi:hypothetical protein
MRKLALAGIVGMLVGAGGAVALASSISSTVAVEPAAAYLSAGSPEHPQGVRLAMGFGWQGLSPASQPQVTKLDLWFPRGTVYNGALSGVLHVPDPHEIRGRGSAAECGDDLDPSRFTTSSA